VRGADRAVGAWIALGGSALMAAGAVLAVAQISVTIDISERRRRTAAVDARDAADPAAGAAPPREPGGPLWTPPAAAAADGDEPVPAPDGDGPALDPDRTQPLPRVPRPDDES